MLGDTCFQAVFSLSAQYLEPLVSKWPFEKPLGFKTGPSGVTLQYCFLRVRRQDQCLSLQRNVRCFMPC